MRPFDRDLIRGGHYGKRSCEPHSKAEHMAAPTNAAFVKKVLANSEPSTHGPKRTFGERGSMSASLIGRLGSSTFRPSAAAVSMSLTGSCFSSESAPGPFHHGIRRRGGTIFWAALPIASAGPSGHANSPHPSSREGHHYHSTAGWILELPPIAFDPAGTLSCRRSCLPGPAELGAVNPDAVHDHGQPTCQSHDCLFRSEEHTAELPSPM